MFMNYPQLLGRSKLIIAGGCDERVYENKEEFERLVALTRSRRGPNQGR